MALESPTHSLVDAALRGLPGILPVLDFSTIKNELFPVIAAIFSKTNSLAIKVRGLQAFVILCGGTTDGSGGDDGLDGLAPGGKKTSSSTALDKYTMQEKIVPLVKAIKTKEPAVMMAALDVLRVVGQVADAEFVAMDIIPVLWSMSLGPLLELKQFQTFMELVKTLSRRVEDEQTKKLQELSGTSSNGASAIAAEKEDFMAFGGLSGTAFDATNGTTEDDFERLVKGKASSGSPAAFPSWDDAPAAAAAAAAPVMSPGVTAASTPKTPAFSWSTPSPTGPSAAPPPSQFGQVKAASQPGFRTVTPDLGGFQSLQPSTTQFSRPLQPMAPSSATAAQSPGTGSSGIDWSAAGAGSGLSNPWAVATPPAVSSTMSPSFGGLGSSMGNLSLGQNRPAAPSQTSSFSLAPPPGSSGAGMASSGFSLPPPPGMGAAPSFGGTPSFGGMASMSQLGAGQRTTSASSFGGMGMGMGMNGGASMNSLMGMQAQQPPQQQQQQQQAAQPQRSGLDKYESLL